MEQTSDRLWELKRIELQDRFLRTFQWVRRAAGRTQAEVATTAGWQQPYVARLELEKSPLIDALARIEAYSQACGATAVLVFADPQTGEVLRTLALSEAGDRAAERIRSGPYAFSHGPLEEVMGLRMAGTP